MTDKIVLNPILGTYDVTLINDNFDKVEQALNEKVLYRDNPAGSPNQIKNDMDMNSHRILNLPEPQADNEAARLKDLRDAVGGNKTAISILDFGTLVPNEPTAAYANRILLNKAILEISTAGGGVLYIPAGLYYSGGSGTDPSDKGIVIRRNVHLTGAGEGATILKRGAGASLMVNEPNVISTPVYGGGENNITISHMTLDGNAAYSAAAAANITYWYCSDNIHIHDVTFLNAPGLHSIDMNGCRDFLIENCQFKGHNAALSELFGGPTYFPEAIQLAGETDNFTIEALTPKRVKVVGCYFGPSDTEASVLVAMGNHTHTYNKFTEDVVFMNNVVDTPQRYGVRPFSWKHVHISGNTFKNCPVGILLSSSIDAKDSFGVPTGIPQSGSDVIIDDNVFEETVTYCVDVTSGHVGVSTFEKWRNVSITNNTVVNLTNATCTPFYPKWISRLTVSGNMLRGTFNRGVYSRFCDRVRVFGNHIEGTAFEGVLADEMFETQFAGLGYTHTWAIFGNTMNDIGYSGIALQAVIGGAVDANSMTNVGAIAAGKRPGVNISTGSADISVSGNRVSTCSYGVDITGSCSNITVGPNTVIGATISAIRNLATGMNSVLDMAGMQGSLYPQTDNVDSLGALTKRFTKGYIKDLRVQGNLPVPAVIAQSGTPVSVTGVLTETTLATITVPAGLMGPHDCLEIHTFWGMTNSANNKTTKVKFGGTAYYQSVVTANAQVRAVTEIRNAGSVSNQFGGVSSSSVPSGLGGSSLAVATSAANTTLAQDITITGTLANAGETLTLLGYTVKFIPAP